MKKCLLFIFVTFLSFSSVAQTAMIEQSNERKISDGKMFYYRPSSAFLYQDYQSNDASLQWLYSIMKANRVAILAGKAHFEIFSYISSDDVGNPTAINTASVQASVVRAYLKTRYGIDHRSCTFAIDTTQNLKNVVQLQIVSGPMPQYANTQISYSESRSTAGARDAVRDYRDGVPYMSYLMYMARRNVDFSAGGDFYALREGAWEPEDFSGLKLSELAAVGGVKLFIKTHSGSFIAATVEDIDSGINILYSGSADGTYAFASAAAIMTVAEATNSTFPTSAYLSSVAEGFVPASSSSAAQKVEERIVYRDIMREKPIFGVKTNLIQWAAVMPNIGFEFYIGKFVSLELSASYTWLSGMLGQEKSYYMWSAGGELRFWINADGKFNGLFVGLYGNTGQYDFKFGSIGNQGDFYSAGLSVGYVLPIGKNFAVEFALAGGYINYFNQAYKWDGKKNVPLDPVNPVKNEWKIFPTKATVALLWKF